MSPDLGLARGCGSVAALVGFLEGVELHARPWLEDGDAVWTQPIWAMSAFDVFAGDAESAVSVMCFTGDTWAVILETRNI